MNHIIEYIGKEGVRTTEISGITSNRLETPSYGDPVKAPKEAGYPFGELGLSRLDEFWTRDDGTEMCRVCCSGGGSHFLNPNGTVSVSGGPFCSFPVAFLTPLYQVRSVGFWNWGDNSAGAGQGVNYQIARPTFLLDWEEYEVWRNDHD